MSVTALAAGRAGLHFRSDASRDDSRFSLRTDDASINRDSNEIDQRAGFSFVSPRKAPRGRSIRPLAISALASINTLIKGSLSCRTGSKGRFPARVCVCELIRGARVYPRRRMVRNELNDGRLREGAVQGRSRVGRARPEPKSRTATWPGHSRPSPRVVIRAWSPRRTRRSTSGVHGGPRGC